MKHATVQDSPDCSNATSENNLNIKLTVSLFGETVNGEREGIMTNVQTAEKLRSFGIHPSQPRIAIYSYLETRKNHPTADMVYADLSPEYPSLSKTTVYNTLKLFRSSGAVQSVIIEDGEMRFDSDVSRHAHFKCTACGSVYDLFYDPSEYLPAISSDFAVEEIHVNYRGKCKKCSCGTCGKSS